MSRRLWRAGLLVLIPALVSARPPSSTETYRDGFEGDRPSWRQEEADLTVRLKTHERSELARHEGTHSERFVFTTEGSGSSLYYSLPLPKIPLAPEMEVALYARANQPGVQLLVRVVLPADRDPDTGLPSFLLVPGTIADNADRWERLELVELSRAAESQARILRVRSGRKVSLEGAYLDRLVVNLYGGPGETEVFLDDLSITPVPAEIAQGDAPEVTTPPVPDPVPDPEEVEPTRRQDGSRDANGISLDGGRLTRAGHDWFPSILSAPGADLSLVVPFGFDVVEVDPAEKPETLRAAAALGTMLMPNLGGAPTAVEALRQAENFPVPEAVAFWMLGGGLGAAIDPEERKEELVRVRKILTGLRDRPAKSPKYATATVSGDFAKYAAPGRELDLMGVDPQAWGSSHEPGEVYQYLQQRRQLTALWDVTLPHWAWVDATAPASARAAVWGSDTPPIWGMPRVQPEQVRLAAFTSVMAGYKAVGFRADAELTRPAGRAVLYEMGLINAELDLVESILARGADPILALPTFLPDPKRVIAFNAGGLQTQTLSRNQGSENRPRPESPPHGSIKAAAISTRDGKGRLLVITDLAGGAQWQPSQMALNDLVVRVPGAPESSQVLEITLGEARWLDRTGVPGGVQFTIPEFGVTTLVLVTTDLALGERVKRAVEAIRPQALDMAIKQARLQYDWVNDINFRLASYGRSVTQANDLMGLAARSIEGAEQARANEDYALAWDEARRAGRPLRILMRLHWDQAFEALARASGVPKEDPDRPRPENAPKPPRRLIPPVASAPLNSFSTLLQHYIWCDLIRHGQWREDLLPTGSFDDLDPTRWTNPAGSSWTAARAT